jgi:hypothetical protein
MGTVPRGCIRRGLAFFWRDAMSSIVAAVNHESVSARLLKGAWTVSALRALLADKPVKALL